MKISENIKKISSLVPSTLFIVITMTIMIFLLPFGYRLDVGPGPDSVMALIWEYIEAPWQSGFGFVDIGIFFTSII